MFLWGGIRRNEPWLFKRKLDRVRVWYKKGSIVVDMVAVLATAFEASIIRKYLIKLEGH